MALWNLTDKTILIVDDFPEMRSLLRSMVAAYGAQQIEQARDGDEAIKALSKQRFDIVLCDYNLGDGKDGQQVLEEAKHRNLLPFTTCFIMVTAENTSQMVMGALEYQPDAYLSKPVTKTVLQVRLKKLLEKKDSLGDIAAALDSRHYAKACELCDKHLQNDSKIRFELLKLKSDVLIRMGDYERADALCQAVIQERELPWAMLDLGKVNFHRQQYTDAAECFSGIIKDNSSFVAAYDWLAKTQLRLDEPVQAQNTLMEAVDRSSKSLLRQRALADIADKNGDCAVTEQARRKAIRVGKGSVLRRPDDYTGLAKVLVKNNSAKDALKVVESIKYEFRDNPQAELEAVAAGSGVYAALGNDAKSAEALDKALELAAGQPELVTADVGMDLAQACLAGDRKEAADALVRQVVQNHHDDEEILGRVGCIYQEAGLQQEGEDLVARTRKEIVEINNQGVALLKQGKIKESIDLFSKAAKGMPRNPIVNLNAAHSIVRFMKETGPSKPQLAEALAFIQAVGSDESHSKRRNQLMAACREFSAVLEK